MSRSAVRFLSERCWKLDSTRMEPRTRDASLIDRVADERERLQLLMKEAAVPSQDKWLFSTLFSTNTAEVLDTLRLVNRALVKQTSNKNRVRSSLRRYDEAYSAVKELIRDLENIGDRMCDWDGLRDRGQSAFAAYQDAALATTEFVISWRLAAGHQRTIQHNGERFPQAIIRHTRSIASSGLLMLIAKDHRTRSETCPLRFLGCPLLMRTDQPVPPHAVAPAPSTQDLCTPFRSFNNEGDCLSAAVISPSSAIGGGPSRAHVPVACIPARSATEGCLSVCQDEVCMTKTAQGSSGNVRLCCTIVGGEVLLAAVADSITHDNARVRADAVSSAGEPEQPGARPPSTLWDRLRHANSCLAHEELQGAIRAYETYSLACWDCFRPCLQVCSLPAMSRSLIQGPAEHMASLRSKTFAELQRMPHSTRSDLREKLQAIETVGARLAARCKSEGRSNSKATGHTKGNGCSAVFRTSALLSVATACTEGRPSLANNGQVADNTQGMQPSPLQKQSTAFATEMVNKTFKEVSSVPKLADGSSIASRSPQAKVSNNHLSRTENQVHSYSEPLSPTFLKRQDDMFNSSARKDAHGSPRPEGRCRAPNGPLAGHSCHQPDDIVTQGKSHSGLSLTCAWCLLDRECRSRLLVCYTEIVLIRVYWTALANRSCQRRLQHRLATMLLRMTEQALVRLSYAKLFKKAGHATAIAFLRVVAASLDTDQVHALRERYFTALYRFYLSTTFLRRQEALSDYWVQHHEHTLQRTYFAKLQRHRFIKPALQPVE
ncbi:hypothetical protein DIPPA_51747 [Diplonema papillatum]|nr:hypothetical protein DIPPA_51747 [Diplonema papillatum]